MSRDSTSACQHALLHSVDRVTVRWLYTHMPAAAAAAAADTGVYPHPSSSAVAANVLLMLR